MFKNINTADLGAADFELIRIMGAILLIECTNRKSTNDSKIPLNTNM